MIINEKLSMKTGTFFIEIDQYNQINRPGLVVDNITKKSNEYCVYSTKMTE